MCATCGCAAGPEIRLIDIRGSSPIEALNHPHSDDGLQIQDDKQHTDHPHPHEHPHPGAQTETVRLEERILAKNDRLAENNRTWLQDRGVRAVNLMSSPGSGKTTLLERTVRALSGTTRVCVIEGDQETTFDADRIKAAGAPVLQINTGAGCHLDAAMVGAALRALDPTAGVVLIENVGNLVCPALFDLGESARAVIMSVTEGADKPLKYPNIFAAATVVVLNKTDLLPYVDFDLARFRHDVALVNSRTEILPLSASTGDGLDAWFAWVCDPARSPST